MEAPVVSEDAVATDHAEPTVLNTADDDAGHLPVELGSEIFGHPRVRGGRRRIVGSDAPLRAAVRIRRAYAGEREPLGGIHGPRARCGRDRVAAVQEPGCGANGSAGDHKAGEHGEQRRTKKNARTASSWRR
jgi:hypothetical protein